MSEQRIQPPSGIYEGYLMKKKTDSKLNFFGDTNKRYFSLNLSKYELMYYSNRKKKGKPNIIPMREIIEAKKVDESDTERIGTWTNKFILSTNRRNYELRSYSCIDRDAWLKAFNRLIQYKKEILRARGINFDDVFTCVENNRCNFDLAQTDFDGNGFIKDINLISRIQIKPVIQVNLVHHKINIEQKKERDEESDAEPEIRYLQPNDHEMLKKYFNIDQHEIDPKNAKSRNERTHK